MPVNAPLTQGQTGRLVFGIIIIQNRTEKGQLWEADPGVEGYFRVKVTSVRERKEASGLSLGADMTWN